MNTSILTPLKTSDGKNLLLRKIFNPGLLAFAIILVFSFFHPLKSYAGGNPVIYLKGDTGLLDTMKVERGYQYSEPGDSAHSDLYGDLTQDITVTSSIVGGSASYNKRVIGTYIFSYNVTDPAGLKAVTKYRVVRVTKDITPPVLKVNLGQRNTDTIYLEIPPIPRNLSFLGSYFISSIDYVDGNLSGGVIIDTSLVQDTVVGVYKVTYSSTDSSGNKATVIRYLKVENATGSFSITLNGSANVNVCQYSNYTDQGYTLHPSNAHVTVETLGTYPFYLTTGMSPVTIIYVATDDKGNRYTAPTRYITVIPAGTHSCPGKLDSIDTVICKGSCPVLTAPISGDSYRWSTGDTTRSITACINSDTAIAVSVVKDSVLSSYLYLITVTKTSCVWPGDANYDGVADKNDVLAIGVAYGDTGAKRSGASLNWTGQPCNDWASSFKSGANYKNADCNGDGTVDSTDMAAVTKNYGLVHYKTNGGNGSPTDPPLSITFSKDSALAGDTVTATITLGSSGIPVENAYGLAFSIPYNFFYVKPGKASVNLSNCWLGTPGKDLVYFLHDDPANNVVDFAITRIDHKNITSGYGAIGKVSVVMQDNLGGKTWVNRKVVLTPSEVNLISFDETQIPLYAQGDSMIVTGPLSGIYNTSGIIGRIKLYPNPASQNIFIDAGDQQVSGIRLINELGKQVFEQTSPSKGIVELPLSGLGSGIYTVIISTKNGTVTRQILKN